MGNVESNLAMTGRNCKQGLRLDSILGYTIRLLLAASALLQMSTTIRAAHIDVAGDTLEIPSPIGFSAITPKMVAIFDFQTKSWPESAVHYLTFIQDFEVPVALKNEIPDMERRLAVTTVREVVGKTVRRSDFAELKSVFISSNEKLAEQIKQTLPDEMEKQSKRMSAQAGASVKMDIPQSVRYPPHDDSERSFAISTLNSFTQTGSDGKPTFKTVSVTTSYLHVRGKLLVLYAYGEKDALTWTRDTSKHWADAILAANPDEKSSAAGSTQSRSRDIDWVGTAVIGLLTAGLWGAFAVIRKQQANRQKKD